MEEITLKKIIGFFVGKGLLLSNFASAMPSVKLDARQVVEAGLTFEPRLLEVLPAAILHYPRSFIFKSQMPEKLKEVLASIKKNSEMGPNLGGITYAAMKRWADKGFKDKRTVALANKRVMKSYRLKPETLAVLKTKARSAGVSETEFLEIALKNA